MVTYLALRRIALHATLPTPQDWAGGVDRSPGRLASSRCHPSRSRERDPGKKAHPACGPCVHPPKLLAGSVEFLRASNRSTKQPKAASRLVGDQGWQQIWHKFESSNFPKPTHTLMHNNKTQIELGGAGLLHRVAGSRPALGTALKIVEKSERL